uniref:Uncharacterized protein n=1 Tax=uncultured Armatimonadetes bacterium TaxID=157466 RepID=A0A6J4HU34_9BACT|nr:hypothetical protein AVDCRST_MAG63-1104 [uncultured Armatimonadetes bacterium]
MQQGRAAPKSRCAGPWYHLASRRPRGRHLGGRATDKPRTARF